MIEFPNEIQVYGLQCTKLSGDGSKASVKNCFCKGSVANISFPQNRTSALYFEGIMHRELSTAEECCFFYEFELLM